MGLEKLQAIKLAAQDLDVRPSSEGYYDLAYALDLQSALTAAEATIRGAMARTESRGAHQRADFPHLDPALLVNFTIQLDGQGNQVLDSVPVRPIPSELLPWIRETELEVAGRLLE